MSDLGDPAQSVQKWSSAISAGDTSAIVDLASDDVELWVQGLQPIAGKNAVAESFEEFFQHYSAQIDTEIVECDFQSDLAIVRAVSLQTFTARREREESTGRQRKAFSLFVLQRDERDSWRIKRQIQYYDQTTPTVTHCSWCNRTRSESEFLLASPDNGLAICGSCISDAAKLTRRQRFVSRFRSGGPFVLSLFAWLLMVLSLFLTVGLLAFHWHTISAGDPLFGPVFVYALHGLTVLLVVLTVTSVVRLFRSRASRD